MDKLVEFWDKRHRTTDEWRSGGDRGIDIARNRAFYARRLGLLVGILDQYSIRTSLQILDAGCGKGWLSEQLVSQGHDVVGIDPSRRAIEICRERCEADFFVSTIANFRSKHQFDAVICMDVLFHIVQQDEWERSVVNLGSLLGRNGIFVFSEVPGGRRYEMGDYIVHRPLAEYDDLLSPFGLKQVGSVPYDFAGNPNSFIIYKNGAI